MTKKNMASKNDQESLKTLNNRGDKDINDGTQAVQVLAKEIGAKYSTKYEIYKFLNEKCGIYLPAHRTVTIYFLKDVMSGKKKSNYIRLLLTQLFYHINKKTHIRNFGNIVAHTYQVVEHTVTSNSDPML